jgi:hypothetical protein
MQTSDARVKEAIRPVDTRAQLNNVRRLHLYNYSLKPAWSEVAGRAEDQRNETGVLAQELREVLPDAVHESGPVQLGNGERIDNLLVVNKDRVYMENLGAVQELSRMTDTLESRIRELESLNREMRRRTIRRPHSAASASASVAGMEVEDKDGPAAAAAGGRRRTFPWLTLCAWLVVIGLLAAVLSVGAALLVNGGDSNTGNSNNNAGSSTGTTATPQADIGGSTTWSTTTGGRTSTSNSTAPYQCLDGSWQSSVALCPDRVTFAFSNAYTDIVNYLPDFRLALQQSLAAAMDVSASRITELQVGGRWRR